MSHEPLAPHSLEFRGTSELRPARFRTANLRDTEHGWTCFPSLRGLVVGRRDSDTHLRGCIRAYVKDDAVPSSLVCLVPYSLQCPVPSPSSGCQSPAEKGRDAEEMTWNKVGGRGTTTLPRPKRERVIGTGSVCPWQLCGFHV